MTREFKERDQAQHGVVDDGECVNARTCLLVRLSLKLGCAWRGR